MRYTIVKSWVAGTTHWFVVAHADGTRSLHSLPA